jgi:hypothetical protein
MAEGSKAYFINRKLISHLIHFLPMNRFQNSLWDSCHWGTTCTTNLDVWLAAQCFWNTFLISSYMDYSIRYFIVMEKNGKYFKHSVLYGS